MHRRYGFKQKLLKQNSKINYDTLKPCTNNVYNSIRYQKHTKYTAATDICWKHQACLAFDSIRQKNIYFFFKQTKQFSSFFPSISNYCVFSYVLFPTLNIFRSFFVQFKYEFSNGFVNYKKIKYG